ncbi:hypothetical protein QTP88_008634 [Uroleucon formosanum]
MYKNLFILQVQIQRRKLGTLHSYLGRLGLRYLHDKFIPNRLIFFFHLRNVVTNYPTYGDLTSTLNAYIYIYIYIIWRHKSIFILKNITDPKKKNGKLEYGIIIIIKIYFVVELLYIIRERNKLNNVNMIQNLYDMLGNEVSHINRFRSDLSLAVIDNVNERQGRKRLESLL